MEWTDKDMNEGEQQVKEPGKYLGEIKMVKEKTTTSGDAMWSLKFVDSEGNALCWDNLVFNTAGKGIAKKKMAILGVPKNSEGFYEIASKEELIGLRATLDLKRDKYTDNNGNTIEKLVPDFYGEGNFGYSPEIEKIEKSGSFIKTPESDLPF